VAFAGKKAIKRAIARMARLADRCREPVIEGRAHIHGLEHVLGIGASSELVVRKQSPHSRTHIRLGRGVWIGQGVEVEATEPHCVAIGNDTSLQHGCIVRGDVRIGAHCTFARNVTIISTHHHFRDCPQWLIRDQDRAFLARDPAVRANPAAAIRIGEDCWFGAASAVMAGVEVGRGAVIGANCVVTRDIGPYEIHGGVPNRRIGTRMDFAPPEALDAMADQCLPYFYSGFLQARETLLKSRERGVIWAGPRAQMVLAARPARAIVIAGRAHESCPGLRLSIRVNGIEQAQTSAAGKDFTVTVPLPSGRDTSRTPRALRDHVHVEITAPEPAAPPDAMFGIAQIDPI